MAGRKFNGNIVGTAGAIAGMVAAVAPVVTPIVSDVVDKLAKTKCEETIAMPALYDKQFPLRLDQAMELLAGYGLKGMPSMLTPREANVKYKDCFEGQVIGSKPRANQKVQPGVTVLIRCVPQDVIDESQRLFNEAKKQKAAAKMERVKKRTEQRKRAMELAIDTANKAGCSITKAISGRNPPTNSDTDSISEK